MWSDAVVVRMSRLSRAITCNECAAWWAGIAQAGGVAQVGGVARQVQERVGRQMAAWMWADVN